jgi:hypothetical protein
VSLELGELFIKSSSGEAWAESAEYVVGRLTGLLEPGEFTLEDGCVEQGRLRRPGHREWTRIIDGAAAGRVHDAGPKPDGRMVPFADAPDAHHESQGACRESSLIGVGNDTRVAQRSAFDGVFAGECRTDQQFSRLGAFHTGIEPIGEFFRVSTEGASKVAVARVESYDDVV